MRKETKDRFITAVIGLLGVGAGAWFQHFLTIQQEREKTLRDLRLNTYERFFEGQAKRQLAANRRAQGDTDEAKKLENEYASLVRASAFPIAAFGGREVIESLAKYYKINFNYFPCGGSRDTWIRDMNIYQNMRREILQDRSENVEASDLVVLLFSCTLPK